MCTESPLGETFSTESFLLRTLRVVMSCLLVDISRVDPYYNLLSDRRSHWEMIFFTEAIMAMMKLIKPEEGY